MSEQGWLGNDVWDAATVRDPLFDPNFCWWSLAYLEPHNHPAEQRCGPDCPSTPVYADVYADIGLPNPWTDWPRVCVFLAISPDDPETYFYGQRFIFGDVPGWTVTDGSWLIRQENSDQ